MNGDNPTHLSSAEPGSEPPQPGKIPFPGSIFVGPEGLRAGWRALLFFGAVVAMVWALATVIRILMRRPHLQHAPTVIAPGQALLNESVVLIGVLLASAIFAGIERRSFAEYGLPARGAFGAKFWEGLLWGFGLMSAVLAVLRTTGNFYFGQVSLPAGKIAALASIWAAYFVIVGVAEEFAFRGYPLFIMSRGMGFWPAAVVLAIIFGAVHLGNSGENWLGAVSIVVVALLLAFTLRRTGNLWFAIGMHAAWDWAESFFYGVPDSGVSFAGHLLNPSFRGSKWVTGGSVGPEASVVTLLGYVVVLVLINLRFPQCGMQGLGIRD